MFLGEKSQAIEVTNSINKCKAGAYSQDISYRKVLCISLRWLFEFHSDVIKNVLLR